MKIFTSILRAITITVILPVSVVMLVGCGKAAKLAGKAADEVFSQSDEVVKALDSKVDDIGLPKNSGAVDELLTSNDGSLLKEYFAYTMPGRVARAIQRERETVENDETSATWYLSHEITYVVLGLDVDAYAVWSFSGCSRESRMIMDFFMPQEELPDDQFLAARMLISEKESTSAGEIETYAGSLISLVEKTSGQVLETIQELEAGEHWKASRQGNQWQVTDYINQAQQIITDVDIATTWQSEAKIIKSLMESPIEYKENVLDLDSDNLYSVDSVRIRPLDIAELNYPIWEVSTTSQTIVDGVPQEDFFKAIYTKNGISPMIWFTLDGDPVQLIATDISVSDEGFCNISNN